MDVKAIGQVLCDSNQPLKKRFRALFTLKNLGGVDAIEQIALCFKDSSALLKHECAYCLGQMQDPCAVKTLVDLLSDKEENSMVRHEAGEALGAIADQTCIDKLTKFSHDDKIEVAETCELALARLNWLQDGGHDLQHKFNSVDPAPASDAHNIHNLTAQLLDEKISLFERYRAMFALRNLENDDAVLGLVKGFGSKSALFRHEIAFVFGQLQHPLAIDALEERLRDEEEHAMVRHEAAEALGAIATERCVAILKEYLKDDERVVRESCEVALDISEYENSDTLQYADCANATA